MNKNKISIKTIKFNDVFQIKIVKKRILKNFYNQISVHLKKTTAVAVQTQFFTLKTDS